MSWRLFVPLQSLHVETSTDCQAAPPWPIACRERNEMQHQSCSPSHAICSLSLRMPDPPMYVLYSDQELLPPPCCQSSMMMRPWITDPGAKSSDTVNCGPPWCKLIIVAHGLGQGRGTHDRAW